MAKKKNKNGGQKQNNSDQQQNGGGKQDDDDQQQNKENSNNNNGGGKKDDGPITVVLKVKMDCECEGCVTKIKKCVRGSQGVESVKGFGDSNKLTVIGKVDPVKLREMIEKKAKKKVELVSPLPKKDKDGGGGGEKKTEGKLEKKPDEKKSKEPPLTTAVMKVNLHCHGCIQRIRKTVTKTKGYHEMSIDEQKGLVMVKGTIDMKALAGTLQEKLKRQVEIVPPKKDGGEKKEKGNGGGGGEKGKGGGEKGRGGEEGQNDGDGGGIGGGPAEENRLQYVQYGYPSPHVYGFGLGYPVGPYHAHAPQIFSDENPNACTIM